MNPSSSSVSSSPHCSSPLDPDHGHLRIRSRLLSTSSRWVVDQSGRREARLRELGRASRSHRGRGPRQPTGWRHRRCGEVHGFQLRAAHVASLPRYQCFPDVSHSRRVARRLGLAESAAAVAVHNPQFVDLTLIQAFKEVVSTLDRHDIMVILDNQISTPGWCCSKYDGNGFFGDTFFDPNEWLRGLQIMAETFNSSRNVVGMSLRNELRGPKQNLVDWYRYMQMGAEAVHLGFCVLQSRSNGEPVLVLVGNTRPGSYTSELNLVLKDAGLCLQAGADGEEVKFGTQCKNLGSKWVQITDSRMLLSLMRRTTVTWTTDEIGREAIRRAMKALRKRHLLEEGAHAPAIAAFIPTLCGADELCMQLVAYRDSDIGIIGQFLRLKEADLLLDGVEP
ncbi:hypothetical protein HPP92_021112 [Vanilla planifolia]|uniref:Uncharacterized protein n=1 Tax=Vanilla planifolia TaxID=51239 RepID=A0A835PY35_VANPL|nr:hypothetical protein HPP92_021112 [Vanilla planifolia]